MSSAWDSTVALVSTTSMSNYLGIPSGGTEETQVDMLINAAGQWAIHYTDLNTIVRTTSLTEYYDGDNSRTLLTLGHPINAVTSLWIDVNRVYGSDTLIDPANYAVYNNWGMIKTIYDVFIRWPQSVKLTYDVGYATIPSDIQSAMMELVRFWYERGTGDRVGMKSLSVMQTTTTYETDIPSSVKAVLDEYKRWSGVVR